MSEDKMREEFHKYMQDTFGLESLEVMVRADTPTQCSYAFIETQASWEIWKACAAIKDAEIADKVGVIDAQAMAIQQYQKQLDDSQAEIAARDLMIKELRDALTETIKLLNEFDYEKDEDSDSYSFFEARLNEDLFFFEKHKAEKALAATEHHNSRALEKVLLDAKQQEREHWANEFSDALQSDLENGVKWLNEKASKEFVAKYPELNRVLAELNKE